jgi:hypothetical protein
MGKLTILTRSSVRFDPRDPLHRLYYYQYIRTNRQGECPVRFTTLQDDQGNMVEKVRRMLCDYYTGLEFQMYQERDPNSFKVREERIIAAEVPDEIPTLTDRIGETDS